MEFCAKNNIKFIKFLLKNKMPLFSNSDNYIINESDKEKNVFNEFYIF